MSIRNRWYIPTDFWVYVVRKPRRLKGFRAPFEGTGKSLVLYKDGLIDIQDGSSDKS
jgi:hypothetical protein